MCEENIRELKQERKRYNKRFWDCCACNFSTMSLHPSFIISQIETALAMPDPSSTNTFIFKLSAVKAKRRKEGKTRRGRRKKRWENLRMKIRDRNKYLFPLPKAQFLVQGLFERNGVLLESVQQRQGRGGQRRCGGMHNNFEVLVHHAGTRVRPDSQVRVALVFLFLLFWLTLLVN